MGKECERAEVEKIDSIVVAASKHVEGEKLNGGGGGDVELSDDAVDDNQEEQDQSIFKTNDCLFSNACKISSNTCFAHTTTFV